jgi:uncharacterized membrane protein YfcA
MPIEWWLYPVFGVVAGLLAGLLGVGGGLVLVAGLAWLLPSQGIPASIAMHAALATSLATIVITGVASARAHHRRGSVLWPSVYWLLPGLLLGAWLGSGLATRLSGTWLRNGVAFYCLVAALQLWLDWPRARAAHVDSPRGALLSVAGVFIGAISSLVGIGGGSMTVPLLVWRGVPPVRAVGTSSACGVGIGLASALGYATHTPTLAMPAYSWGYVYVPAAIGIAVTSMLCAPYGARLAHRLSGLTLKRIFALFLLAVGVAMAFS